MFPKKITPISINLIDQLMMLNYKRTIYIKGVYSATTKINNQCTIEFAFV